MCSCDGDDPPDPRSGPTGPADGTRGVVGTCSGELEAGVWMCELDDKGVVTHLIID